MNGSYGMSNPAVPGQTRATRCPRGDEPRSPAGVLLVRILEHTCLFTKRAMMVISPSGCLKIFPFSLPSKSPSGPEGGVAGEIFSSSWATKPGMIACERFKQPFSILYLTSFILRLHGIRSTQRRSQECRGKRAAEEAT